MKVGTVLASTSPDPNEVNRPPQRETARSPLRLADVERGPRLARVHHMELLKHLEADVHGAAA